MKLPEWVTRMIGRAPTPNVSGEDRAVLGREEDRLAAKLAVITGKRRDEVLAEAYRRADRILGERRP